MRPSSIAEGGTEALTACVCAAEESDRTMMIFARKAYRRRSASVYSAYKMVFDVDRSSSAWMLRVFAVLLTTTRIAYAAFADVDLAGFTSGSTGYRVVGGVSGDYYGGACGVGDVNGDGFDDLAIAGTGADPSGRSAAGAVMVIYGHSTATSFTEVDPTTSSFGTGGFRIYGAVAGDNLGVVAAAGDVNGDGIDDIIVGSEFIDPGGLVNAGAAYVVFGRPTNNPFPAALDLLSFTSGTAGIKIVGAYTGDRLGCAVGGGGDVNGDGYDDIIVGAKYASPLSRGGEGAAFVIFGHNSSTPFTDITAGTFAAGAVGFSFFGSKASDNFGLHGSTSGDVNGDGVNDILVTAPYGDLGGRGQNGIIYIMYGHSGAFSDIDMLSFTTGAAGFRIFGKYTNSLDGFTASIAGDINDDGYDDVITGARLAVGEISGNGQAGVASVVFGRRAAFTSDVSLVSMVSGTLGYRIYGVGVNDLLGMYVAIAGDVNADGIDDILVSATGYDAFGRTDSGMALVIFGHSNKTSFQDIDTANPLGELGYKIYGALAGDSLGYVEAAGDVNGDGKADFVVSAGLATVGARAQAGAAYVIFGTYPPPTVAPSARPTGPTWQPTSQPSCQPSRQPTSKPSIPTSQPSSRPSCQPSRQPTSRPSRQPSRQPSSRPSRQPSQQPTSQPSRRPSSQPSAQPSNQPSARPSRQPSRQPSSQPTNRPVVPSSQPSRQPTNQPSSRPSSQPSTQPSQQPMTIPSSQPSSVPSGQPFERPSGQPSSQPSASPSAGPSRQPSAQPSSQPSADPTAKPSTPTVKPTVSPTAAPSISPAHYLRLLSSPTYRARNGFAFAGLAADGGVHTWGEAPHGGDASAFSAQLSSNISTVVGTRFAFAAVDSAGRVVAAWGAEAAVHGASLLTGTAVHHLVANEAAFAGIDQANGEVVAFGSASSGGDVIYDSKCNGYSLQLSANVTGIAASAAAFAAVKSDGTVYAWGNPHAGAGVSSDNMPQLAGVSKVVATREAFAALLSTGRVVTWGSAAHGGDSSAVASELQSAIVHIAASNAVFVAITQDQRVVAWGYGPWGGDASAVTSQLTQVVFVAHTYGAMAVMKSDGSVVAWGDARSGGDASAVQAALMNVEVIYGNSKAFAALKVGGGVVAWGKAAFGGHIPSNKISALSSGVVSMYHTERAFAALKSDGSVIVWGQAGHGGSSGAAVEAHLVSGVHTVCSNDAAFSAIKTDGSVVAWGNPVSVPKAGIISNISSMVLPLLCT